MILSPARRGRAETRPAGRVLPQSEMSPVFVVIADVFFQQPSQVPLVQNDHVVEQIPTHTSNPALGDAVLPGTSKSGSDRFCAMLFDGRDDVIAENLASRSKIRNLCGCSYPQASRSCSTIHKAFG